MAPTVSAVDVQSIASDVWQALVGDAAMPSGGSPQQMPSDALRAWVIIDGPWRGHVQLVCGRGTAAQMAAAVMGGEADQVAAEDVDDVLGELANVVGGAVKSLLPGSAALGLPRVEAHDGSGADGLTVLRVDLVWREQPVALTLCALIPAPDHP